MGQQLSIDDLILEPGLYRCTVAWVNEMGYKWQHGEQVRVLKHDHPLSAWCIEDGHKQGFCLSADKLRTHFVREDM